MKTENSEAIWVGAAISAVLLCLFWYLQREDQDLLELPVQYLVVAAVPLILGLLLSGHIKKISAGNIIDLEFEQLLAKSELIPDPALATKSSEHSLVAAWTNGRAEEYQRTHGYMLAHVYRPSSESGQVFDVSIFIVRHQKGTATPPLRNFNEIEKAEFFFGESWGNKVFDVAGDGGFFGARVHAWGTFLAMCRVTFKDTKQTPILLYRYVDFSMTKSDI